MPNRTPLEYTPPFPFTNGNIATIYPPLFRPTPPVTCTRERIETPDRDFLDLDRHPCRIGQSDKLAIISHGLEGHSRKKYVLGMAHMATNCGYDAACWIQRGCGDDPNRFPHSYHSGATEDLHTVVQHCLSSGKYTEVALIGFSMGGNQILKYLGEAPARVPSEITQAATFSVPCDLAATSDTIAQFSHWIYQEYFMRGLRDKIRTKSTVFPDAIQIEKLKSTRTLRDFDTNYTAPLCGFHDASDYYARSSSLQFIPKITIPTLIVQAQDDPFLTPSCYPHAEAASNEHIILETPRHGGHVGFVQQNPKNEYWSETRVKRFLSSKD